MAWDDSMWGQSDDGSNGYNDWGSGATPGETSWTVSDDSSSDSSSDYNYWAPGYGQPSGMGYAGVSTGYIPSAADIAAIRTGVGREIYNINNPKVDQQIMQPQYQPPTYQQPTTSQTIQQLLDQIQQQQNNAASQALQDAETFRTNYTTGVNNWATSALGSQLPKLQSAYEAARAAMTNQQNTVNTNYQTGSNNLQTQLTNALPQYQTMRNQADVTNAQEQQKMRVANEQLGMLRGGNTIRGQAQLSAARQNNQNDINQTEQAFRNTVGTQQSNLDLEKLNTLNQIAAAVAASQKQQPLDELALQQGIDADKQKYLMDAETIGADYGIKLATLQNSEGNSNIANIIAAINAANTLDTSAWNKVVDSANLTGNYNGIDTLTKQIADRNEKWKNVDATGILDGKPTMEGVNNAAKAQAAEMDNQIKALKMLNIPRELELELQDMQQKVLAGSLGYAEAQARIAQIEAQTKAAGNKTPTVNSGTTNTIDDYAKYIDDRFVTKANQNNGYSTSMDEQGIVDYLNGLQNAGVDENILRQIAARYNIGF